MKDNIHIKKKNLSSLGPKRLTPTLEKSEGPKVPNPPDTETGRGKEEFPTFN